MGDMIEIARSSVQTWECDQMGHMNVQFYVAKADEGMLALAAALGLSARAQRSDDALLLPREQHIRFHRELRPGAPFVVTGGVVRVQSEGLVIYEEMQNIAAKSIAATFVTRAEWCDIDYRGGMAFGLLGRQSDADEQPAQQQIARGVQVDLAGFVFHGNGDACGADGAGVGAAIRRKAALPAARNARIDHIVQGQLRARIRERARIRTIALKDRPATGYVASANRGLARTRRLNDVFGNNRTFTLDEFKDLQHDVVAWTAGRLVPLVARVRVDREDVMRARRQLLSWDRNVTTDSVAAAIYVTWERMLRRMLAEQRLDAELAAEFVVRAGDFLVPALTEPSRRWFDGNAILTASKRANRSSTSFWVPGA